MRRHTPVGHDGRRRRNPRGYWEPRAALQLNEQILYRHGSSYFDPTLRLQEDGALDRVTRAAFVTKIADYLRALPNAPVTVIKALHISVLSDMWFEGAHLAGFDVAAALAVRDPQEVAASLSRFMHASPQLSCALWLKYNLLAERATRGIPRVFVEYVNVLDDWRREMNRISRALPIDLDTGTECGVEEFLEQGLRRERQCGPVSEPFGTDWLSVVYRELHAAAQDELLSVGALDRVLAEYQASERGFRTAFDDFHRLFNMRYRFTRVFMKPIYGSRALAHGRRGTWT